MAASRTAAPQLSWDRRRYRLVHANRNGARFSNWRSLDTCPPVLKVSSHFSKTQRYVSLWCPALVPPRDRHCIHHVPDQH
ncbi:uncharacterized [Tachysurus ichikawai]